MSFGRYPAYKDSGVEWLGEVPDHWAINRVKNTTYLKGRVGWKGLTSEEYLDTGYAYLVTGTDFIGKFIEWRECHCVEQARYEDDPFIQLKDGDLLITKDGTIGKLALVTALDKPACLNSGIFLVRPKCAYLTDFMYWVLRSNSFQVFCDLCSLGSTIQHLYQNVFEKFVFPTPGFEEQTRIAAFLDRETAKIDELVAEQQRLIDLLTEKRQAVISHAVTKGLNPAAPMKPSGIEWLGDVPVHWVVGKLGYSAKLRGGYAFSAAEFGPEGIVVVRMNNLKRGQLDLSEAARIPESSCATAVALADGDLIWGMSGSTGETGSLGNFARVRQRDLPCQLNQRVGRFVTDKSKLDVGFLEQVIQTQYFYEQIMLLVTGTAQFNVSSEQVQSCLLARPPMSEQSEITEFIIHASSEFDSLIAEAQRAIDLLQERRTALISAAVTGQIDVRHLAEAGAA